MQFYLCKTNFFYYVSNVDIISNRNLLALFNNIVDVCDVYILCVNRTFVS